MDDIKKHLPRFISASIYICKGKIGIYSSREIYDMDSLCKKYKRYNCPVKKMEYLKEYMTEFDVSKAKNKIIRDKIYFLIDTLSLLADKISDTMIGG